jgi:hypothetical protein
MLITIETFKELWMIELVPILFEELRGSIKGRIGLLLQSKMGLN